MLVVSGAAVFNEVRLALCPADLVFDPRVPFPESREAPQYRSPLNLTQPTAPNL